MRKTIIGPNLGEGLDLFDDVEGVSGLPHSEAVAVELADYTRVFIAGTGPLDADERIVGPGDPVRQLEVVLDTIEAILATVGGTPRDLVRLNLVREPVSDDEAQVMSKLRHAFIVEGHEPASTTVVTDQVGIEGMCLEVDAEAIVPRDGWEVDAVDRAT